MKRTIVALALLVCLPAMAMAQDTYMDIGTGTEDFPVPGCGSDLKRLNKSSQLGPNFWLQYLVETTVDLNLCIFVVTVEANVQGIAGSAQSSWGVLSASVYKQLPVPRAGWYTTLGYHTAATSIPGLYVTGRSLSEAEVRDNTIIIRREEECVGEWDSATEHCIWMNCPLIVNMDRRGYHLSSAAEGVLFDLDVNGAPERVAWTRADSQDAFLALDRNGNGRIDDGTELFGNHTPAYFNGPEATTANGFEALRFTQGITYGFGTQDDVIDARDPVWAKLLLWTDRNHNGISEPEELTRVADSAIAGISLTYRTIGRVDQFGNEFRQRAEITWKDGRTSYLFDVWLARTR